VPVQSLLNNWWLGWPLLMMAMWPATRDGGCGVVMRQGGSPVAVGDLRANRPDNPAPRIEHVHVCIDLNM
jgi:hypothetical protein